MEVYIQGCKIRLTKAQVAKIQNFQWKQKASIESFAQVLRFFGFEKMKDPDLLNSYQKGNWYAEINDHGNWQDVWMTGKGLKSSSTLPGGWIYHSPKELSDELNDVMRNL